MSLKEFKKLHIKEFETSRLQSNVAEYVNQITSNPTLDFRILEDISVSTTATDIDHGLGRPVLGYFIIKSNAQVTIFDTTSTTPNVTVKITASATATINLYVF